MMNLKTKFSATVLLVALTISAAANAATAAPQAKILRYASQDDPQTLDPHSANLTPTNRVISQIYESLVARDKDFKIVPGLALWWSTPDTKTWRFKLRPNVKFHDGSPFTADDVVFSVERSLHPLSQLKSSLQGVASAKKIDTFTVDFVMKEPNPVLLNHLYQFRVMSKSWATKNNALAPQNYKSNEDTFSSRNANGTGPFMLKLRQPDVKTVLIANPNWWNNASKEKGNVTQVEMLPIKSNATRVAALLSGEIDFVLDPPQQDVARLKADPNIKIAEGNEARIQYFAFDQFRDELLYSNVKGKNPLKDLRVRQAIGYAIDVNAIRQVVMRGLSTPTGSIVPPGTQGYSKEADKRLPFDREKAKALLAEAGYPMGFSITLDCGANQPPADICQAVAAMLTQIGIRTTPNIVPLANYFSKLQKFDTSFYLLSWGATTFDSFYTLQALLNTNAGELSASGDSNYGRYSNPKMDELIGKIKSEFDMKKRNAWIREALLLNQNDIATLPLHQPVIPWAMRKNIEATFAPNNIAYFFRFKIN